MSKWTKAERQKIYDREQEKRLEGRKKRAEEMRESKIECCLCGISIQKIESNNAQPIKEGRCCGYCNSIVVIPARIKQMKLKESQNE